MSGAFVGALFAWADTDAGGGGGASVLAATEAPSSTMITTSRWRRRRCRRRRGGIRRADGGGGLELGRPPLRPAHRSRPSGCARRCSPPASSTDRCWSSRSPSAPPSTRASRPSTRPAAAVGRRRPPPPPRSPSIASASASAAVRSPASAAPTVTAAAAAGRGAAAVAGGDVRGERGGNVGGRISHVRRAPRRARRRWALPPGVCLDGRELADLRRRRCGAAVAARVRRRRFVQTVGLARRRAVLRCGDGRLVEGEGSRLRTWSAAELEDEAAGKGIELWHAALFPVEDGGSGEVSDGLVALARGFWSAEAAAAPGWAERWRGAARVSFAQANARSSALGRDARRREIRAEVANFR